MVGLCGLEPQTSCVSSRRSNQLSYKPDLGIYGQHVLKLRELASVLIPCQGSKPLLNQRRSGDSLKTKTFSLGSYWAEVCESGSNGR